MQQNKNENFTKKAEDVIIVPPGCDTGIFEQCGDDVCVFAPESYVPYTNPKDYNGCFHNMSQKTGGLSIPKDHKSATLKSMAEYLRQFQGAYLCLDLWMNNRVRIKKCGFLSDIGDNFLVIREQNCNTVNVIDLKPIKYISIYCK